VLVTVGIATALLAAHAIAHSDSAKARLAFRFTSAEIASKLKLAIQHEEDLILSGRAFVVGNRHASPADFATWAQSVEALKRYPELQDIGLLVMVRDSQLAAFKARMLAHPVLPESRQPAESRGAFDVFPYGHRADYCFAAAGVVRNLVAVLPPGLDYCALEPAMLMARDSGHSSYLPFKEGSTTTLAVQTPIYSGGGAPATVAGRRSAFLGWLGESLVPQVVLNTALEGHPGMAVSFRYRSGPSDVAFRGGMPPRRAESSTIDLHNGWTVQSFGSVASAGTLTDARALTLLLGGTALSLLVGALLFVLGTGRTRAMSLVREKTRELSYQALHDSLTGLPNRARVIQRAEEMLRRRARMMAALFVDLDGFKRVNDNHGHAAGDELLKVIARRLRSVVREEDIVGRLGGDEFVVLLDSPSGDSRPDVVAERVIETLRAPAALQDSEAVVSVSASVGIAVGPRSSVDALLRDADLALYAAKAAGKDRYILFEPAVENEPTVRGEPAVASDPESHLAPEEDAAQASWT
jgi:diguanylate cyclase (GGDEF)-like protein